MSDCMGFRECLNAFWVHDVLAMVWFVGFLFRWWSVSSRIEFIYKAMAIERETAFVSSSENDNDDDIIAMQYGDRVDKEKTNC